MKDWCRIVKLKGGEKVLLVRSYSSESEEEIIEATFNIEGNRIVLTFRFDTIVERDKRFNSISVVALQKMFEDAKEGISGGHNLPLRE